jgi:hypothetical protein
MCVTAVVGLRHAFSFGLRHTFSTKGVAAGLEFSRVCMNLVSLCQFPSQRRPGTLHRRPHPELLLMKGGGAWGGGAGEQAGAARAHAPRSTHVAALIQSPCS